MPLRSASDYLLILTQSRKKGGTMTARKIALSRMVVVVAMTLVLVGSANGALTSRPAEASQQQPSPSFSFAVYGDSRPMMYLPYKQGQPEINKLFLDMFGLVLPEKVAEAVVKKDVKMIFDPVTKELIQIDMPLYTASEHTRLTLKNGWVTEASVEDVKLAPGVLRTIFRLEGGDWVAREIVKDVQSGRAKFVINSGDVVW